MSTDPKTLGLINALLASRNGAPALPLTLSSLSRGLLGVNNGLGALSSDHARQPRLRGVLEQVLARSEHDRLVEKLRARLFAAYVRNRFAEFALIVPIGSALAARSQLCFWGLTAAEHGLQVARNNLYGGRVRCMS